MNKLEKLRRKFKKTENELSIAVQEFAQAVVFKGFENYEQQPNVTYCHDGIIIEWLDDEMYSDKIIEIMNKKGYICPADFGY